MQTIGKLHFRWRRVSVRVCTASSTRGPSAGIPSTAAPARRVVTPVTASWVPSTAGPIPRAREPVQPEERHGNHEDHRQPVEEKELS